MPLNPAEGVETDSKKRKKPSNDMPTPLPWWNRTLNDQFSGGVIFMNPGKQACSDFLPADQIDKVQLVRECVESLKRMHAKGYCHCDVRVPNICKFGDEFEMIDFGFARKLSDSGSVRVRVDQPKRPDLPASMVLAIDQVRALNLDHGQHIKRLGYSFFVNNLGQICVDWTPKLDFEMLFHNIRLEFPVPETSTRTCNIM
jgi:serine/threonine protein kinase